MGIDYALQASAECGSPQSSLVVLGQVIDHIVGQALHIHSLYVIRAVGTLAEAQQGSGLASHPYVAVACTHDGVGRLAKRGFLPVQPAVTAQIARQRVAAVIYAYALVLLRGQPPMPRVICHKSARLHPLRAADDGGRMMYRRCLGHAVTPYAPLVALPVGQGRGGLPR